MNVRSFPPENSSVRRRNETAGDVVLLPTGTLQYKVPFLDIARRFNLLDRNAACEPDGGYASVLFSGAQPGAGFSEQMAFRHYLNCLRGQVLAAERATFDETVAAHRELLDNAETLLSMLSASGIRGQQRDFSNIIDVNRAALELFTSLRGAILRRRWGSI
jgi:hypothetical protein